MTTLNTLILCGGWDGHAPQENAALFKAGLPERFTYDSEQYYMLIDPAIEVLAETTYTYEERACRDARGVEAPLGQRSRISTISVNVIRSKLFR